MSLPVVLRPEASQDAEEARDHLEALRAGLGQAFLDRLNEVLARIGAMPEMYGVAWRNVRAARLQRFTYAVAVDEPSFGFLRTRQFGGSLVSGAATMLLT